MYDRLVIFKAVARVGRVDSEIWGRCLECKTGPTATLLRHYPFRRNVNTPLLPPLALYCAQRPLHWLFIELLDCTADLYSQ